MAQVVTVGIDTPERPGEYLSLPVAAGVKLFAGELIAVNSGGFATFAGDTAGEKVVGRCEADVDNSADGVGGALSVKVKRGVFKFANAGSGGFTSASLVGAWAYVSDDQTVAASGTTNSIKAGAFFGLDPDGNVWVDTRPALFS